LSSQEGFSGNFKLLMSVLTNETFDKSLTSNRTFHLSQERQIESLHCGGIQDNNEKIA
jgi:hypothetical protein